MAKAKKTQKENLEPIGELKMTPSEKLEQCEWVFQFDGDEPQIFAWTGEDMTNEEPTVTFTISNTKDAFSIKTDFELLRAHFLFKIIENRFLVKIGAFLINFSLKFLIS